jgi:hypothetical protein
MSPLLTSVLLGLTAAGMVHQYLPHDTGGNAIEVGAAGIVWVGLANHTEISLMNQCGWLQGVSRRFAAQIAACDLAKFLVNQRNDFIQGSFITVA